MLEKAVYCGVINALLGVVVCLGGLYHDSILEYSTLLGPRNDFVWHAKFVGIGVDHAGCAYVSTSCAGSEFPIVLV